MERRLEKLTYVHDGELGPVGDLLMRLKRVLRFGADGSGLIRVGEGAERVIIDEQRIPVVIKAFSELTDPTLAEIADGETPCLIAHSGAQKVLCVNANSLARCGGSPSELRGKVRFGLARVGWALK